jgi:hypothetical protein
MHAWMGLWLGLGSKNFSGVCGLGCSVREIADHDVGEQSDIATRRSIAGGSNFTRVAAGHSGDVVDQARPKDGCLWSCRRCSGREEGVALTRD